MQDNWQEFDRQMQSVLQDAREKAPRRVWRAVSARLDSAAPAAIWWRWAVPAFAVAAIVAGLFLAGTFDRSGQNPGDINILAETDIISPAEDGAAEAQYLADASSADMEQPSADAAPLMARSGSRRAAESRKLSGQDEDVAVTVAVPAEDNAGDAGVVQAEDAETGKEADEAEIAAQWARIAQEESTKSVLGNVKVSGLYAQGSVGGNDSNISYGGNGISRMAPGSGSVNAGVSEAGPSTYGVPFTVGMGVRFHVTDRLSFGTGVDYSLLTRSFTGSYNGNNADKYEGSIFHSLQYVGAPLNVYYDLLQTRDNLFNVYAWGGGEAEVCVSNRFRLMDAANTVITDKAGSLQFSVALGLGMEFKLSETLGLYADPSVRYYFHGNQPKSVRTDKPFMFNFDAGLRFNF